MTILFEVGKFYKVQTYGGTHVDQRKIRCKCVRRTMFNVWFEHLFVTLEGSLEKRVFRRKLRLRRGVSEDCNAEEAYDSTDVWTTVVPTVATETAEKPSMWDDVDESAETHNQIKDLS